MKSKIKLLLGQFDKYLKSHVHLALEVTKNLKALLESPVADMITALIPGQLDDIVRSRLVAALQEAVIALTIADNCREQPTLNDKLKCFASQLKEKDESLRDAILHKLASLMAGTLDSKRFKQYVYDLFTQAGYATVK